jgi:hypothetical protein
MYFYAYIPREDGTVPMGTEHQRIFNNKYKSLRSLLRYGLEPKGWKIYSFTRVFDESTYTYLTTY